MKVVNIVINVIIILLLLILLLYYIDRFFRSQFKLNKAKKFNKRMKDRIKPVDQKEYQETMALLKEQMRRKRIKQTKENNKLEKEKIKRTFNISDKDNKDNGD